MEIVVEHISELTKKLTITLPAEVVAAALTKAYIKINKEVQLKGFRRGKIPRSVLEKNFKEQVQGEVAEQLIQESYFDAVEQEKLEPVVHPEIPENSFPEDGTFVYVAFIDTKPQFELQGYKGLALERPGLLVTGEDVDKEIALLQRHQAVLQTAEEDHAIATDDVATVDFQGFDNGKAMPEVHKENYKIDMGAGSLGMDFETKLLGLKKDEKTLYEVDFPVTYPNPVLAGKKVEFKVNIKEIQVRIKPGLDDEFAKDVNPEMASLEALKEDICARLLKNKENAQIGDLDDQIMLKLIDMTPFEVPQRLVNFEIQEMLKEAEENLKRSGLSFESAGIDLKELVDKNREIAIKRVKGDFLLKKVAELEGVKVSDDDLQQGYQRIADQYRMSVTEVKSFFKRREELMPFMNELLNEKILNFLREQANITEIVAEAVVANEGHESSEGNEGNGGNI